MESYKRKKLSEYPRRYTPSDDDLVPTLVSDGSGGFTNMNIPFSEMKGAPGEPGSNGQDGQDGSPGPGVAPGGTTGQVLKKGSNADYDTEWGNLDKASIGLSNVDNTSDANKPVSTQMQLALDSKEDASNKSTSTSLGTSDTAYPSQKAVKTYVDNSNKYWSGVVDVGTTTTQVISGVGFMPSKVTLVWLNGLENGVGSADKSEMSGANGVAIRGGVQFGTAFNMNGSNMAIKNSRNRCFLITRSTGSLALSGYISSWSNDGFTITFTTPGDKRAYGIVCEA